MKIMTTTFTITFTSRNRMCSVRDCTHVKLTSGWNRSPETERQKPPPGVVSRIDTLWNRIDSVICTVQPLITDLEILSSPCLNEALGSWKVGVTKTWKVLGITNILAGTLQKEDKRKAGSWLAACKNLHSYCCGCAWTLSFPLNTVMRATVLLLMLNMAILLSLYRWAWRRQCNSGGSFQVKLQLGQWCRDRVLGRESGG